MSCQNWINVVRLRENWLACFQILGSYQQLSSLGDDRFDHQTFEIFWKVTDLSEYKWEHFSKCPWLCFSFWVFVAQFLYGLHCDNEYMDMYSKIRAKVISFKSYLDSSSWKFQCISNGIERGQFNWEVQFNRMHHFLFLQQATWKAFCISIRYSTWFKIFCFCLVWIWKRREIHATTWQIHILTGTNLCYNFGKSM